MDAEEFRETGKRMVDFLADYVESIESRPVLPDVRPGDIFKMLPDDPPNSGESLESVLSDVEKIVIPGVTQWQHPNFHAYFPTGNAYPSVLADMLSGVLGCLGFTWIASPACTEVEMRMMNWLAKMLGLPKEFMFREESGFDSTGGGVIQGSASESVLMVTLAAKADFSKQNGTPSTRMALYCSDQAHNSVERAGLMAGVTIRKVASDGNCRMTGDALRTQMEADVRDGLTPMSVIATLGTTSSCAFDDLSTLGPVCRDFGVWLHVDAAYAGNAFVCPEFRHHLRGIEFVDSFNFNPTKWLQINADCSVLWVRDSTKLESPFKIGAEFLADAPSSEDQEIRVPEYRYWHIPLGRRFRSLKIWFVVRMFGVEKLRHMIRKQVELAKRFEALVAASSDFEVTNDVELGLVCFRFKGDEGNERTRSLLKAIERDRRIYLVPADVKGKFVLRFVVVATKTEEADVDFAWSVIRELTTELAETLTKCETKNATSSTMELKTELPGSA